MRRPAAALTLLLALTLVASAQAKPALGIADQKPETFLDPRLGDLHLKHARLYMPWDVLKDRPALASTDAWFTLARGSGMKPLITISGSRRAEHKGKNPTPAQLAREYRRWRARWPGQMNTVSTWNEANLGKKPELVARWWRALRSVCSSCTILGADLLDEPKVLSWTARFVKAAKRSPKVWGLHAYNDANTFSTKATRAFLRAVKGDVWITETGGVADRARPVYRFAGCGIDHQTEATRFLLNRLAGVSPRIKRIYLFNWGLGDGMGSFDAALVDTQGRERPALNLVREYLGQRPIDIPPELASPQLGGCKRGSATVKVPKRAKTGKTRSTERR